MRLGPDGCGNDANDDGMDGETGKVTREGRGGSGAEEVPSHSQFTGARPERLCGGRGSTASPASKSESLISSARTGPTVLMCSAGFPVVDSGISLRAFGITFNEIVISSESFGFTDVVSGFTNVVSGFANSTSGFAKVPAGFTDFIFGITKAVWEIANTICYAGSGFARRSPAPRANHALPRQGPAIPLGPLHRHRDVSPFPPMQKRNDLKRDRPAAAVELCPN